MKLINILNFTEFYNEVKNQSVPFKTAYKLFKIANRAETEVNFYKKKLTEIIVEYAQKDENGAPKRTEDGEGIQLIPGLEEECGRKIAELQEIEVDIEYKLTLEDLEQFNLTPALIQGISEFIED